MLNTELKAESGKLVAQLLKQVEQQQQKQKEEFDKWCAEARDLIDAMFGDAAKLPGVQHMAYWQVMWPKLQAKVFFYVEKALGIERGSLPLGFKRQVANTADGHCMIKEFFGLSYDSAYEAVMFDAEADRPAFKGHEVKR